MGDGTSDGVLNINVGIMGHVDSGKTSLARALSTTVSTAGLDKHPQSQERGITLDLGFSSFAIDAPEHIAAQGPRGSRAGSSPGSRGGPAVKNHGAVSARALSDLSAPGAPQWCFSVFCVLMGDFEVAY